MSLEQVVGDVRRDGEAKAQQAIQAARKEAQAILEAARAQAQSHEAARLAAAEKEAAAVRSQAASRAESEARKAVLATEAQLRGQMRQGIATGMGELPRATREKHLKALLSKAQAILPKGTVWGAAQDATFLAAQKPYKHGGNVAVAGGIVVESEDGKTRLDLTYETLLDEAWRDILKAEAGLFH
jgi:V/A-type H+-transporting ATPase subunit E